MGRWLHLVPSIMLVACYAPRPDAMCVIHCTDGMTCPDGMTCEAQVCVSFPGECTDQPAIDNDEDDDGVLNDVDNCPGIENGTTTGVQADEDGDRVGDPCDPHPGDSGDHIEHAEFFNDDVFENWTRGTDTWAVRDGALEPLSNIGLHGMNSIGTVRFPTIELGVTFETVAPTTTVYALMAGGGGLRCLRDLDSLELITPGGTSQMSATAITGGSQGTLRFRRDPVGYRCSWDATDNAMTGAIADFSAQPIFEVVDADIQIHYVVVYSYAPP
ncbi:MAG: hypothetical protein AB7O24_12565 [Kofleriaceae bacterium]